MHTQRHQRLARLQADLEPGAIDPAAVYWLTVYSGALRSDRWVEAGLAAASRIAGPDAAAQGARRALVGGYDLSALARLKDGAVLTGEFQSDHDWQYLCPDPAKSPGSWDLLNDDSFGGAALSRLSAEDISRRRL